MCGMMRIKLVAILALVLAMGAARAATEVVDGMTYTYQIGGTWTIQTAYGTSTYSLSQSHAVLIKAEGDNKTVVIPEKLGGATVIILAAGAFMNNTTVMKVKMPNTITMMAGLYDNGYKGVFSGCAALTSCEISSGVTAIPDYCFWGCGNLRSVQLPKKLNSIGNCAFYSCTSLETINLPEGLTSIGSSVFNYCPFIDFHMPDSVTSIGSCVFYHCESLVSVHLSNGLTAIPNQVFDGCSSLREINIPSGVTVIGGMAFEYCISLREIVLPAGLTSVVGYGCLGGTFEGVGRVVFNGKPPAGVESASIKSVVYPKEYGALWQLYFPLSATGGYVNPNIPIVSIISSGVRQNAPNILDVVYKVTSKKPTVKVRALAFEDGVRSFAKVTRPETFVADTNGVETAGNVGDTVAANVEHTLSWQVSSDFKTDLAKMKFEVLAVEDDILPLEFITIPANGTNKSMELSWNLITESQVYDALLWLYANKDNDLTLTNGDLKNGSEYLARGASLWNNYTVNGYGCAATPFVFSKMGYNTLTGVPLSYANEMTRMGLSPNGSRQYAYKWID